MRSRAFVINPPRSALGRTLWLVGIVVLLATLLFFSAVIVAAGAALFALAWLVRRVIRPRGTRVADATARDDHVIEGEFVVIESGRRTPG